MKKSLTTSPQILTWTLLATIVILFVLLAFLWKPKTPPTPTQSQAPTPIVIVKADTSNPNIPPHFPQDQPRYNSSTYQQVGVLTSEEADKEPIVLPLFGRKISNRSDRWQYYTATDKNNMMRIPLSYQNRDCEEDVGCNEIYTGDQLQVSIYQGRNFTATVYRTQAPSYFSSPY
jgi:hypothetical protein